MHVNQKSKQDYILEEYGDEFKRNVLDNRNNLKWKFCKTIASLDVIANSHRAQIQKSC